MLRSGAQRPSASPASVAAGSEPSSTMVSSGMLLLGASCWLLVVLGRCEEQKEARSPDYDAIKSQEEELIEALQEVLEKLRNKQLPSSEKKLGWLPPCDAGEECAVRKGSRIGKLCGCPRGTLCNFSVLKCP